METLTSTVKGLTTQVAELKTLQWELLAEFQYVPIQVIKYASKKDGDYSVPLVGLVGFHPAEGEKNTHQITISQLFQRKAAKDAEKANQNKPIPTTTPARSTIPPIITTTTTQLQSPFLLSPPKRSSQSEGDLIKKDKGKKAISSKDAESGEHVHFTEEQIKEQKRIEESFKADVAKQEVEARKEEWIDLFGVDVSIITNSDVLTRKGPITLKVYREDGTDEVIPNFKASDLHLGELREVYQEIQAICLVWRSSSWNCAKRANLRLHQGPGLDDHARTFSSLCHTSSKVETRGVSKGLIFITHGVDIEKTKMHTNKSVMTSSELKWILVS
ncbi:hypothetical protein Tco_1012614 [Tanacetum coccineum]